MFYRWYRIFGMSENMYETMKDEFDEDVTHFKEESGIHIAIFMNIVEYYRMKHQVKKWNKKNRYKDKLYLVKD